jgi:hypothetical protein
LGDLFLEFLWLVVLLLFQRCDPECVRHGNAFKYKLNWDTPTLINSGYLENIGTMLLWNRNRSQLHIFCFWSMPQVVKVTKYQTLKPLKVWHHNSSSIISCNDHRGAVWFLCATWFSVYKLPDKACYQTIFNIYDGLKGQRKKETTYLLVSMVLGCGKILWSCYHIVILHC